MSKEKVDWIKTKFKYKNWLDLFNPLNDRKSNI